MDESKRPLDYVAEPDLQGIEPLAYEAEQEKIKQGIKPVAYDVEQENIKSSGYRPNNHNMRRNTDRRGGRIDGMGSATRNNRFSEPREWTQNSPRSAPRNDRFSEPRGWTQNSPRSTPRNDRFSEPRDSPQSSQRPANRWSRVKPSS